MTMNIFPSRRQERTKIHSGMDQTGKQYLLHLSIPCTIAASTNVLCTRCHTVGFRRGALHSYANELTDFFREIQNMWLPLHILQDNGKYGCARHYTEKGNCVGEFHTLGL